jgi:hypothetical protein
MAGESFMGRIQLLHHARQPDRAQFINAELQIRMKFKDAVDDQGRQGLRRGTVGRLASSACRQRGDRPVWLGEWRAGQAEGTRMALAPALIGLGGKDCCAFKIHQGT